MEEVKGMEITGQEAVPPEPPAETLEGTDGTVQAKGAETEVPDADPGQGEKETKEERLADPPKNPEAPADQTSPEQQAQEDRLKVWEQTLKQREADLNQKEVEDFARSLLREKELPEEMLPYLVQEDKEKTQAHIDKYAEHFSAALEKKLSERLTGKSPAGTSGTVSVGDKSDADVFAAALRR